MKNMTDITFILDRSGSMASMVNDVVGGWKTFVEQQKAQPGDAVFSLVQFDDQYETPFTAIPLKNLNSALEFFPRGGTALRDAVGRTINNIGARLRLLPESERPDKVLVVIMTDGEENSSVEFSQEQIKRMVEHQTEKYGWEFIFLGANINSFDVGSSYGIAQSGITNWSYTKGGQRAAFNTVSSYTSCLRSGDVMAHSLTDEQSMNEANLTKDAGLADKDSVTLATS